MSGPVSGEEVQIIITTHSPVLITDLPDQCLQILHKDMDDNITVRWAEKTFGANIHDIYRNAFEIKGQRTGNLSAKYLRTITDILDKEFISESEKLKLETSLNVIGDHLLIHHINRKLIIAETQKNSDFKGDIKDD